MKPHSVVPTGTRVPLLSDLGDRVVERLNGMPTWRTSIEGLLFGLFYVFSVFILMQSPELVERLPKQAVGLFLLSPGIFFFVAQYRKGKRAAFWFFIGWLTAFMLINMIPLVVWMYW